MKGIVKSIILITADVAVVYTLFKNWEIVLTISVFIASYPFLWGGAATRAKMRAVPVNRNSTNRQQCITDIFNTVKQQAAQQSPSLNNVRLYIIPKNEINAYAIGMNTVAITEGTLNIDNLMIEAILAHELGHLKNGDSTFLLAMTANLMGVGIALLLAGLITYTTAIIIFLLIIFICNIHFNFVSISIFSIIFKGIKGIVHGLQFLIFSFVKLLIMSTCRGAEFSADAFSASLGYGPILKLFLEQYGDMDDGKTLTDIIFDTHPNKYKRIARIEQYELAFNHQQY